MGRPDLKPCPRQCTVWPNAIEKGVIILHEECRVHAVHIIVNLLGKYGWEIISQPAYSPDLSPCDYDLKPKLKESMLGVCFWDTDELKARLTQEIYRVNREGVLDGIQVALQGDYIEGF